MNALIVEDEMAAARRLRKLIKQIDPSISILAELDSVESAVEFLKKVGEPDLIFLDVHLADGSSFEIFRFVEVSCPVIFTTAYDEYALQAFSENTIDYLLKPIKKLELERALGKYAKLFASDNHKIDYAKLADNLSPQQPKRFLLRVGQQLKVVEMKEVAYFYTEAKITFLVTTAGKRYSIDFSMEQLEEITPNKDFFRINRQFIVGLSAITEMHSYSKSRVKLILAPLCKLETIVSTERSPNFKKWLEGS